MTHLNFRSVNSHGTKLLYPHMSYAFLMPNKSIRGLKKSSPVNFRFISGEISTEKIVRKIFIALKDSSLNFISEDFGSLLPACPVAVEVEKFYITEIYLKILVPRLCVLKSHPNSLHFRRFVMQLITYSTIPCQRSHVYCQFMFRSVQL